MLLPCGVGEWVPRAAAVADELAGSERWDLPADQRRELAALLRGLCAEIEMADLTLEARLEELVVVRQMMAAISYPVIAVTRDVLCLPVVGPVDTQIMQQVIDEAMHAVVDRRASWLIVDLTGAQISDVVAAGLLHRLFRGLRLLGVRGTLSGVSPSLAMALSAAGESLDVPVHPTLAVAIAAIAATQHTSKART